MGAEEGAKKYPSHTSEKRWEDLEEFEQTHPAHVSE
jgi:hypothetical protein